VTVAADASVGDSILVTVRAGSQSSDATAEASAPTQVISATFQRSVSGPDVVGSRVPPSQVLTMEVTVTATAEVSTLADYLPSSWSIVDVNGGTVTSVDADVTRVAWTVSGDPIGSPISRSYLVMSPPEQSPPLSYPFRPAAEFSGEVVGEVDYILVSQPPPAPTNLAAELVAPSGVRLTWDASPGAVGYHVYRDGEMVAAWLKREQEATLKRFYQESGRIRLQPANEAMAPIYTDPANVEVQGKVIGAIRPAQ